jgi:hypothetical protein
MNAPTLGEPQIASTKRHPVSDDIQIPERIEVGADQGLLFELAGPRAKLFFDPAQTRAGIVTCGGLCPGLNNVIRSLFLELHFGYGVRNVLGLGTAMAALISRPPASRWRLRRTWLTPFISRAARYSARRAGLWTSLAQWTISSPVA